MEELCGFRVGDEIIITQSSGCRRNGVVYKLHQDHLTVTLHSSPENKGGWRCCVQGDVVMSDYFSGEPLILVSRPHSPPTKESSSINNNNLTKNFMSSLVKKFQSLLLPEPEKTFRKAGVTNESDALTNEGHELFLAFLLKKHGTEFKTEVVDVLVKEEKEDK